MFETVELGKQLTKEEYEAAVPALRTELLELQRELQRADFPVVVLINGVDGAGKSETLNLLGEWLDVRDLTTRAFGPPTEEDRHRPAYWRYWMALPPKGRMGIFLGSWYSEPILDRAHGRIGDPELESRLARIQEFERALAGDGALIVKLWLHITKKWQKKRFKELEDHRDTRWRVTKADWEHHGRYDEFRSICAAVIRKTTTGPCPWHLIEAEDERHRNLTAGIEIRDRLRAHLGSRHERATHSPVVDVPDPDTILDRLDLTRALERRDYEKRLQRGQARLNRSTRKAYRKGLGSIVLLEGWDAAGKGGCIRRLMPALDARNTAVIRVGAPTDEERAHHYLWRFWRHLPRRGRMTIYDRTWYGRVLVERVEGFATPEEWKRAYREINDFEAQLTEHGIVLVKFWLHISQEEQLSRFRAREETPWKRHKIGEEDYRNRAKANAYEAAVSEMVQRTSTDYAPWTLVEAEDKRHARVMVLETLNDRLARALE